LPTRRQFLVVGTVGGAVLLATRLLDRRDALPHSPLRALDARAAQIVRALVPVVLGDALPTASEARANATREVVEAFDRAVSGLSPAVQSEIADLFGLLGFAPTRILLAGITSAWDEATQADVSAFLTRWRTSRFELQRAGYQAITQLLVAAWYGNPASWERIGYPGPPELGTKPA
jgi:hypothetical protein